MSLKNELRKVKSKLEDCINELESLEGFESGSDWVEVESIDDERKKEIIIDLFACLTVSDLEGLAKMKGLSV